MAGQFGWRARIGQIYPSLHGISRGGFDETRRVVPDGVEFVDSKLVYPPQYEPGVRDDTEAFPVMLGMLEAAAKQVALQKPDIVMQMGGAISIFRGWGGDRDIVEILEKAAGVPATTHGRAEVEAMKRMDIHKVVVCTPYAESVNKMLLHYFTGAGLEVVTLNRLGTVRDINAISPYGIYRPIKETFLKAPKADGVIMMCGAIRTFEIIQALEDDIGKPVITAVQAGLWKGLSMVNVRTPIKGYGKLLESF
jgi:maleate isomerase